MGMSLRNPDNYFWQKKCLSKTVAICNMLFGLKDTVASKLWVSTMELILCRIYTYM